MTHTRGAGDEAEKEQRIKAVQAELDQQERKTRNGLFWLSVLGSVAFLAAIFVLVRL
jgi:hypothetical protein